MSWLGTGTLCGGFNLVNGILNVPYGIPYDKVHIKQETKNKFFIGSIKNNTIKLNRTIVECTAFQQ